MRDTTPSNHHDPLTRDALIHAGLTRNSAAIDEVTDRLVRQGVCRPRADLSRLPEWIARRPAERTLTINLDPVSVEGDADIGAEIAALFRDALAGARP